MAQPVWVLSVDLQTKTATFQSGMQDAAKSARGAFTEIKQGAGEMGQRVGYSMRESRETIMATTEMFGVHLPAAITRTVAGFETLGPAMAAGLPLAALALGAFLLVEHIAKVREEAEKLEQAQGKFETATNNAFNTLHGKLLQAEIQADELNRDHLGALKHQLELIDRQSMDELVHTFDVVAKAADAVFAELKSHWYTQGIGADGAKHALEQFKTQYDLLLAKGDAKGAHDLLAGTLSSAEKVLAFQKQYTDNLAQYGNGVTHAPTKAGNSAKVQEAILALRQAGVGATEKEVAAQQQLVDALGDQVKVESAVNELKKAQADNAKRHADKEVTNDSYRALKQQFEADKAAQEQADRDRDEARNRALARLESGEREKIAATKQGSQERLQAIDAAIKEEEKYGLQETSFYHALGVQRVETVRQMAEEEARIRAEAGREAAQHAQKMGELEIAAEREAAKLRNSGRRVSQQELRAQDIHFADEEYSLQVQALNREIAALDKGDKDYSNKLRAIYDKQEQMERAHQNKITEIKDRAIIEQNDRILAAERKAEEETARGLASVLMRHQSFAAMMSSIGDQIATGMIENAIKSMLAMDMTKEKDASHAARKAFNAGMDFPFPVNLVMAPALGAAAFASVMAFNKGGTVPGVGRGDTVPAVLTPGEHVSDTELTDGLRGMVRSGGANARHSIQFHYRPTYHVSTIDGDGIRGVLRDHADEFHAHVENTVRRMNA